MPKRAVFEISRRELSLDVWVGVHIVLVVEQSSLESQSRGCAKTPILKVASKTLACVSDVKTQLNVCNTFFSSRDDVMTPSLPHHASSKIE